ncbi:hypothetical protein [Curtobacterium sp. MCJR17_020]|uniref:hypothetical protein n=1 Tax=Curtobacterium sp. MCJR17_020 TaxID=2175619 RepID=UPI000DA77F30|nr:hypothetical protein [Curtobacterium sp. MCJR17_020]WIE71632.1 hypothetical protein DEJ14_015805 [Curtobacterium sp. MCJR17_020]
MIAPMFVGLFVGFALSTAGEFTDRWASRLLRVLPIVLWFGWLVSVMPNGVSDVELRLLGVAMFGLLTGMFLAWASFGHRARRRRGHSS